MLLGCSWNVYEFIYVAVIILKYLFKNDLFKNDALLINTDRSHLSFDYNNDLSIFPAN